MWLLLTLFATLCFTAARLVQKKLLTDELDPLTYSIFFQLLVGLLILPVALVDGFILPSLLDLWLPLLLMVGFYTAANITSFLALKTIPISEFVIISATIPFWTVISSIPFLQESANPIKLLGIALTVVGIVVVFYKRHTLQINKGHILAFLSAICFGFAFTNDGFLLQHFKVTVYSSLYFLLPGIFLACLYPKKVRKVTAYKDKKIIIGVLISCILFAFSSLAINKSFQLGGEISQISAILQFSTILTVILGILILKERQDIVRKIIGASVVIVGIILVQGEIAF